MNEFDGDSTETWLFLAIFYTTFPVTPAHSDISCLLNLQQSLKILGDEDSSLLCRVVSFMLGFLRSIVPHPPSVFPPTQIIVTKRSTDFQNVPEGLLCFCWEPLFQVLTNDEVEDKRVDNNFGEMGSTENNGKLTKVLRKNKLPGCGTYSVIF